MALDKKVVVGAGGGAIVLLLLILVMILATRPATEQANQLVFSRRYQPLGQYKTYLIIWNGRVNLSFDFIHFMQLKAIK